MLVTVGSATLAESAEPSHLITVIVAASVAFKGRMVMDRFMELRNANKYIRGSMNLYFYVIPLMIIFVDLFSEQLAKVIHL